MTSADERINACLAIDAALKSLDAEPKGCTPSMLMSALAASGHTIVHSPMTTAFRDATRDLIGKEAWVYGMSEGELRDIVTRAVIAAASAEEGDAVAQASRQECQNDNHDPGCGCGARHWMTAATPAAEEDLNA